MEVTGTRLFCIEVRFEGEVLFTTEGLGDENEFESMEEALSEIPALRALGARYARADYQVVPILMLEAPEIVTVEVPRDEQGKGRAVRGQLEG